MNINDLKNPDMRTNNLRETSEGSDRLPRIALIADVRNWAFHNISRQLVKHLGDAFDFEIFFYGEYPEIETLMLEVRDFDLIHFFWRDALFSFLSDGARHSIAAKGWDYHDFITKIVARANITTSASEHLLISETEAPERVILYNALAIGYTTFSEKLNKALSAIPDYPEPFGNTEDGVDLEFFKPANPERFYREKDEIIVGWVGNSKWADGDGIDHKGLATIIDPVIESLKAEGYRVRGYYADRQERWIPHSEMNDYYNSIDIYVCASDIEGTPNPALESMACGLPVVSTDVGIVPDVFGARQKEYILASRTQEALKIKLRDLIENPQKREALSRENLESIKNWSWEKKSRKWGDFFSAMLSQSRNPSIKERRDYLRRKMLETYLITKSVSTQNANTAANTNEISGSDLINQCEELKKSLDHLQMKIGLMEQSRFWKIRNSWFKVKRKSGFAKNQY